MSSPAAQAVRQLLLKQKTAMQSGVEISIEAQRQQLEQLSSMAPLDPDVNVEPTTIAGIHGEWVFAPNASEQKVFLYLHGGAYYMGSCISHRDLAARLSKASDARVLVIEYRLAPEHAFPAAIEDAVSVYRELVSSGTSPNNIVIGGDSAGGGLTMATLLKLRDEQVSLPAAAVLLSPWTDLEGTGESMVTRAERDPWLDPAGIRQVPALYLQGADPKDPLASPIHADLGGLPPLLVHVGDDECLLDDSVRLVDRAKSAGVNVEFKIWDGMWHVFQSFAAQVPEGQQAIDEIGAYVKSRI